MERVGNDPVHPVHPQILLSLGIVLGILVSKISNNTRAAIFYKEKIW